MSTIVTVLSSCDREALKAIIETTYLDGECYAHAIAFHRAFGWPITGLISEGVVRHALVREPSGMLRDARGVVAESEIGLPFGIGQPYDLRVVTEDELFAIRPIHDGSIETARRLSEYLYPELPWKGEAERVMAFTDELEALSRRYGIWIRAPYPAALPVLSESFGDEAGYTLTPSANAAGYFIDRRLK